MSYKTVTCPHCGATLNVQSSKYRIICDYCDSEFAVKGFQEPSSREESQETEYRQDSWRENNGRRDNDSRQGTPVYTTVNQNKATITITLAAHAPGRAGCWRFCSVSSWGSSAATASMPARSAWESSISSPSGCSESAGS